MRQCRKSRKARWGPKPICLYNCLSAYIYNYNSACGLTCSQICVLCVAFSPHSPALSRSLPLSHSLLLSLTLSHSFALFPNLLLSLSLSLVHSLTLSLSPTLSHSLPLFPTLLALTKLYRLNQTGEFEEKADVNEGVSLSAGCPALKSAP